MHTVLQQHGFNPRYPQPDDPVWLSKAFQETGTQETKGHQHNPRIVSYHACTGLGATDDETPWCSSFMCWIMAQSNITSTRSAASLSWLRWGRVLKTPKRGCVVIFERLDQQGHVIPNRGHVALWLGAEGHVTYCLGGNQQDQVGVNAYRTDRIIGYRWPATITNSTTNKASTTAVAATTVTAAPTLIDVFNPALEAKEQSEQLLAGFDPTQLVSLLGMGIAVAAMIYVIIERNRKIKHHGL